MIRFLVDDTAIVWSTSTAIMMMPLEGGPATTLVSGLDAPPAELAVDDASVFWTTTPQTFGANWEMMKVARAGGVPTVIASSAVSYGVFFVDAAAVWWLDGGGGSVAPTVMTAPK